MSVSMTMAELATKPLEKTKLRHHFDSGGVHRDRGQKRGALAQLSTAGANSQSATFEMPASVTWAAPL